MIGKRKSQRSNSPHGETIYCHEIIMSYVSCYLQRGAFTWSMEATMRMWEQAVSLARYCWVSESRKPGPSMLLTKTQTKHSSSSTCGPSRNEIRSSIDRELKGCSFLWWFPEILFRDIFNWSHRSSANVTATYKFHIHVLFSVKRVLAQFSFLTIRQLLIPTKGITMTINS